jgi:prepilin-type N-terminal cleavage/methylation domain-containing protein
MLDVECWMLDVPRSARHNPASAFTLIEVAISLAVIGVALVAIIGVLPLGMNVQRENREGTIINQDATVFLEAISKGARGLDDLTNYVFAITNNWVLFKADGTVQNSGGNGYTYSTTTIAPGYFIGQGTFTPPAATIRFATNIVGVLSTPELTDGSGNPTNNLFSGGYSNHIIAYVRSISGAAGEKPPQDNPIIRGGLTDSGDSFAYHLLCVNAAVPVDTNVFFLSGANAAKQAYSRQLAANLHELRLTFFWPILPNGNVGNGRQSYRTLIAGRVVADNATVNGLYFYQPQSFTNAP